jgi:hypothetical protein
MSIKSLASAKLKEGINAVEVRSSLEGFEGENRSIQSRAEG